MTEVKKERHLSQGPSEKVAKYLHDQGFTLCDFDNFPIKKSDFVHHKDGETHGHQFPDQLPNEGKVSVLPSTRKLANMNISLPCYWDNDTKIVYGQPAGFDPKTGEIRWKKVYVNYSRDFDLSKPGDRKDFYVFIHSQYMKDGIHDKNGSGIARVEDHERVANAKVERAMKSVGAFEIIGQFTDKNIGAFASLFGISSQQKPVLIKAALFEIAKNNPKDILLKYNDPNREVASIVHEGIMLGVLQETGAGVVFGSENLGLKAYNAVETLIKAPDLLSVIEQKVFEVNGGVSSKREKVTTKASEPEKEPEPKKETSQRSMA